MISTVASNIFIHALLISIYGQENLGLRIYQPAHLGRVRSMFNRYIGRGLKGQGLVEYALILALIAIVVIVILTSIGLIVSEDMYSQISGGFPP
jgi:Flp pilus assembly pilin Flp